LLCRFLEFFVDVFRRWLRLLTGRSSFWLWRFVRFGNGYFVALRRERMLHILAQRKRVDVGLAISCVVKFNLRNLWLKLAISEKVEIVSLRIPGGTIGIKHVVGDFAHLAVRRVPNTNCREK